MRAASGLLPRATGARRTRVQCISAGPPLPRCARNASALLALAPAALGLAPAAAWAEDLAAAPAAAAADGGLSPVVLVPLLAYGVFYVTREVLDKGKKSAEALHILVPDEALASDLKRQLAGDAGSAGLDIAFGKVAAKHSTCPSGKRQGSLGTFKQGMMVKEFDDVVFNEATPLRTVMGPVKTQFGYHLIYVQDRF